MCFQISFFRALNLTICFDCDRRFLANKVSFYSVQTNSVSIRVISKQMKFPVLSGSFIASLRKENRTVQKNSRKCKNLRRVGTGSQEEKELSEKEGNRAQHHRVSDSLRLQASPRPRPFSDRRRARGTGEP